MWLTSHCDYMPVLACARHRALWSRFGQRGGGTEDKLEDKPEVTTQSICGNEWGAPRVRDTVLEIK